MNPDNTPEAFTRTVKRFMEDGLQVAETGARHSSAYRLTEEERKAVIAENFRRGLGHLLRLEGEES